MRKSKLSTYKQRHLLEHFVAGSTARTAASICNVNHKTAAFYYHRLREIIAYELEQEADAFFAGEIEADESYFGGRRKGRRGRGATGKTPVFGLVKRGGVVVRFIRKLSPMLDQQHYSRSLSVKWSQIASFIQTHGMVITRSTFQTLSIIALITQHCLRTSIIILTE